MKIEPATFRFVAQCLKMYNPYITGIGIMQVFHTVRNDNAHYKKQMHGLSGKKDCRLLTSIEEGVWTL
jgi:hypothetical protein